jgi:uracil-DNA glycosylase
MAYDAPRTLAAEIGGCTHCKGLLPHAPRPVVQLGPSARVLIIGQAPGAKVHVSGIPWSDDSGDRLREWMDLSSADFYDPTKVALMPMGFCYPGKGTGGDLPPRPECAPLWHPRILAMLSGRRLTLLVGSYALNGYLPEASKRSMTENVRARAGASSGFFALPHPSWRVIGWARRNPWFERSLLPELRESVRASMRRPV